MERKTRGIGWWLIGLWTVSPMIFAFLASTISAGLGCTLHEGAVNQCVVLGIDIGEGLYTMFGMGWLFLLTLPTGFIAALVFWFNIATSNGAEDEG